MIVHAAVVREGDIAPHHGVGAHARLRLDDRAGQHHAAFANGMLRMDPGIRVDVGLHAVTHGLQAGEHGLAGAVQVVVAHRHDHVVGLGCESSHHLGQTHRAAFRDAALRDKLVVNGEASDFVARVLPKVSQQNVGGDRVACQQYFFHVMSSITARPKPVFP
ncbi:hypothetical protein D9M69_600930 [compost metagenome]